MLTAVLLTFVAVAGPWVVHLAPRSQRLIALVGFIAILLMWLIFENWFTKWYFWIGLLVGIGALFLMSGSGDDRRDRRPRRPSDLTEELSEEF